MARMYLLVALFLALLIPACQPPAAPVEEVPSTEADEAAIRESVQRLVELWNTADLEPILTGYAEDAVLMPSEAPAVVGKEALRTSWTEFSDWPITFPQFLANKIPHLWFNNTDC